MNNRTVTLNVRDDALGILRDPKSSETDKKEARVLLRAAYIVAMEYNAENPLIAPNP